MMRWIDPDRLLTACAAVLLAVAVLVALAGAPALPSGGESHPNAPAHRAPLAAPGRSNPFTAPLPPSVEASPAPSVTPPSVPATPSPAANQGGPGGGLVAFDASRYRVTGVFGKADDLRAVILDTTSGKQTIYFQGDGIDRWVITAVDFHQVELRPPQMPGQEGGAPVVLKVEGSKGLDAAASGAAKP